MRAFACILLLILLRAKTTVGADVPPITAPHTVLHLFPSTENPRNSEGAFIVLNNGDILYVYAHYFVVKKEEMTDAAGGDNSPAYLACRLSTDGGSTWGEEKVFIPREGKMNVACPGFARLKDGSILFGYLIINSWGDCSYFVRKSTDEGKTWSEKVCATGTNKGYFVVNNDRLVVLSSGRIIVPSALHPGGIGKDGKPFWGMYGRGHVFYSDDNGATWKESKNVIDSPVPDCSTWEKAGYQPKVPMLFEAHYSGLQEPGVVELKDGRLMLWARTDLGCQLVAYSNDQGVTWGRAGASELYSPNAPASIKRIPSTGDLLLVINDHTPHRFAFDTDSNFHRTPLCTAISRDEGKTWDLHKVLEYNPAGWYCYMPICFYKNHVLLTYCCGVNGAVDGLAPLQMTLVPLKWLYK